MVNLSRFLPHIIIPPLCLLYLAALAKFPPRQRQQILKFLQVLSWHLMRGYGSAACTFQKSNFSSAYDGQSVRAATAQIFTSPHSQQNDISPSYRGSIIGIMRSLPMDFLDDKNVGAICGRLRRIAAGYFRVSAYRIRSQRMMPIRPPFRGCFLCLISTLFFTLNCTLNRRFNSIITMDLQGLRRSKNLKNRQYLGTFQSSLWTQTDSVNIGRLICILL